MAEQEGEANREGKYLTFWLGAEEYGIGIFNVQEIIGIVPVTALPQAPPYVKGVINLRGRVIPIIDLRIKFKMKKAEYTNHTCIIVVESRTENGGYSRVGLVVDTVSEVVHIHEKCIEDAPGFARQAEDQVLLGMAKLSDGVKILLDVDKVLQQTRFAEIQMAA